MSELNLRANDLRGSLPTEIAYLQQLRTLDVSANESVKGEVPTALAGLDLESFHFSETNLCAPLVEGRRRERRHGTGWRSACIQGARRMRWASPSAGVSCHAPCAARPVGRGWREIAMSRGMPPLSGGNRIESQGPRQTPLRWRRPPAPL